MGTDRDPTLRSQLDRERKGVPPELLLWMPEYEVILDSDSKEIGPQYIYPRGQSGQKIGSRLYLSIRHPRSPWIPASKAIILALERDTMSL